MQDLDIQQYKIGYASTSALCFTVVTARTFQAKLTVFLVFSSCERGTCTDLFVSSRNAEVARSVRQEISDQAESGGV